MTVFQSREYREIYARHFGRGAQFLELSTPNSQIWLQKRGLVVSRLEFWGQGISDVGGAQISGENASELWQKTRALVRQCDGAVLNQIDANSPLVALAQNDNWTISRGEVCPVLAFPDSFEAYVKSLGKNRREQIKRYPKRLEKQFKTEYEMAQTPAQVEEFLVQLFDLHARRWRKRGQTGVLVLPSRQKFHRAICQRFLQNDWLRLWRLKCDGAPACVLLCYFWGGKYWFFIGGFEPELMRWSVGTCLFARIFQTAIAEGAREFDFLKGAEDYKYRFGALDREFVNLSFFAPTLRGKILQKRVGLESALMAKIHEKFGAS